MSEWISVEKELPREFETVLAASGRILYCAFHEGGEWELDGPASWPGIAVGSITHWMELPEPPK